METVDELNDLIRRCRDPAILQMLLKEKHKIADEMYVRRTRRDKPRCSERDGGHGRGGARSRSRDHRRGYDKHAREDRGFDEEGKRKVKKPNSKSRERYNPYDTEQDNREKHKDKTQHESKKKSDEKGRNGKHKTKEVEKTVTRLGTSEATERREKRKESNEEKRMRREKSRKEKRKSFDMGKTENAYHTDASAEQVKNRSKSADCRTEHASESEGKTNFKVQKVFTSDEIAQMSRRKKIHQKQQIAGGLSEGYQDRTVDVQEAKPEPTTKCGTWKPIAEATLQRNEVNNSSNGSSQLSSKLLKLKEEKTRKSKKKTNITSAQRNEERKSEKRSKASAEQKEKQKPLLSSDNTPVECDSSTKHVSDRLNTLESKTKYLDIGDSGSDIPKTRIEEEDGRVHHPTGEIVFRIDMDEIGNKTKADGFSSVLTKQWNRTKSWVKRTGLLEKREARETQVHPADIPQLLVESSTQYEYAGDSKETQTECNRSIAETQTTLLTKSRGCQTKVRKADKVIQTEAEMMSLGTQTEDEDHPVWGGAGMSLDRLVRCKGMRRRATTSRRKDESEELDKSIFKRSATLPTKLQVIEEEKVKALRSYNWTQTDRFIKLNISHSGVHLLPGNKIKILTNGGNLKLTIDTSTNVNANNNSNRSLKTTDVHELYIPNLYHKVSGLSYTVQPDMLTVLLRKKSLLPWPALEFVA